MIFETKDNYVTVPTNISIYGVISCQIFLIGMYFSGYYRQYFLFILMFCLYITSVLYWKKLHYMSVVKMFDLFFASSVLLLITVYYAPKHFNNTYRTLWNYCFLTVILVYIINCYIHYSKCVVKENKTSRFFIYPLTYVNKNTKEREFEYYRSTLTHCIFIHFFPVLVYSFCCYKTFS